MDDRLMKWLKIAVVFAVFALGIYYWSFAYWGKRDRDTAAAFACLSSIIACMISLKLFPNPKELKQVILGLAVVTMIVLIYGYVISMGEIVHDDHSASVDWSNYWGYQSKNVLLMIPCMGVVYFAFYTITSKKQKEQEEDNE